MFFTNTPRLNGQLSKVRLTFGSASHLYCREEIVAWLVGFSQRGDGWNYQLLIAWITAVIPTHIVAKLIDGRDDF